MANVELVSKTVPNKDYIKKYFESISDEIDIKRWEKIVDDVSAEQLMIYIARVSSSRDNKLEDYEGLLNYLIEHGHWSPFEHAYMTVEIETSRAIGRQLLRHRSFTFQEFSQRYSSDIEFENVELRGQPENNRQSSSEVINPELHDPFTGLKENARDSVDVLLQVINGMYDRLINAGVASETARMILPECTRTTLYMKGSVRSWIHYLELRSKENTQKEHRKVANEIGKIFQQEFPVISNALDFDYE